MKIAIQLLFLTLFAIGGIVPKAYAQANPQKIQKENIRNLIQQKIQSFLHVMASNGNNNASNKFSVNRCQITNEKVVKALLSKDKVLTHKMKFGVGCDAQGTVEIKVSAPFDVNLELRKLNDISQLVGKALIRISYVDGLEIKQETDFADGSLFNAKGDVIAKFSANHVRNFEISFNNNSITPISNSGQIQFSEFYGNSVKEEIPISLDEWNKK